MIIHEDDKQKIEILDEFDKILELIRDKRNETITYKQMVTQALIRVDNLVDADSFATVHTPTHVVIIKKDMKRVFLGEMEIFNDYLELLYKYQISKLDEKLDKLFWQLFDEACLEENVLHLKAEEASYDGFLFTIKDECGYLFIYKLEGDEC